MTYLWAWAGAALAFAIIDALWLGVIAKSFYVRELGELRGESLRMGAAIAFYIVAVTGTVFFAVRPALAADSWLTAATLGAAFGFFCYATYDLTNLATLKNWSPPMTIVDIAWGTALTATSATAGYWAARTLGNG